MSTVIESTTDGTTRTIRLSRPGSRNAMSAQLLAELCAAVNAAGEDPSISAVILTGADPAFCAGLDLVEFSDPEIGLLEMVHAPATDPFAALRRMPCPVIAAVNGPAITGGLELALSCDFIVASERARFGDSHAKVGAVPGGGMTGLLPQAVGLRLAKELSFTGRVIEASEALRTGLVNHVVPHDELMGTSLEIAHAIGRGDQPTIRQIKRLYDAGARGTLDDCFRVEAEAFAAWDVSAEDIAGRREEIVSGGRKD
jgi:enoyl-CoA hydratase